MNNQNLKPWPKGVSGNSGGRKRGSKNLSTIVRDCLKKNVDVSLLRGESELIVNNSMTYSRALVLVMLAKAVNGDIRAANWIISLDIDEIIDGDEVGFFNTSRLEIEIIKTRDRGL